MSSDKITLIESYLDSIQTGITTISAMMKPEKDDSEKLPVITASKTFIETFNDSFNKMNDVYKKYQKQIIENSSEMIKSLNQEFKIISTGIDSVNNELNKYKEESENISNHVDDYLKRNHIEPRLCFNGGFSHSYTFDAELMKKYPGCYFMELYNDPSMWMDNGDIYIDHNDDNYESVLKYMKDDETLVEDLKTMDSKRRCEFVNDLDFLMLPVKMNYMNELCFDKDRYTMQAWNKRIIMVNGKNMNDLNTWLKKNELFDKVFNKTVIENVHYNKDKNIMYINMDLKYGDIINEYCKNERINESFTNILKTKETINQLENEMKTLNISLKKEDRTILSDMFITPSLFLKQTTIVDKEYDSYFTQWLGSQIKWKLIYRTSEHNFTASSFHKYCDYKGPTITVIKSTKGWIFGGYTTQSWFGLQDYKNDKNSFLFTLKCPYSSSPKKYTKTKDLDKAIDCFPQFGPIFCESYFDIIKIVDKCNENDKCYIINDGNLSLEYINIDEPMKSKVKPTNTWWFSVYDYEVYAMDSIYGTYY